MKRPTMQEIADALKISRISVWKVLNHQAGVSDSLRHQVLAKAKELGYIRQSPEAPKEKESLMPAQAQSIRTVSVVVSRPESSLFWMNIIHQAAKELAKSEINLMYIYLPSKMPKDYTLPASLSNGTVQGIIILNVYDYGLLSALNQLSLPKVFLDAVSDLKQSSLTGDLVLLEGKSGIQEITNAMIHKGCKDIGFIGDIYYARTNMDRYKGFLCAMNQHNLPVHPEFCFTGSIGIDTYGEEISNYLDGLEKLPDFFVCVSDYVAHFLLQYLYEHEIKVPEEIKLSGFDGSTEYIDAPGFLTTVAVDTRALGKRLVKQLLYRMDYPSFPLEVLYIYPQVFFGESTGT